MVESVIKLFAFIFVIILCIMCQKFNYDHVRDDPKSDEIALGPAYNHPNEEQKKCLLGVHPLCEVNVNLALTNRKGKKRFSEIFPHVWWCSGYKNYSFPLPHSYV